MSQLSAHDSAALDAALAELRNHIANPDKVQATEVGAMPPWLTTILTLAGPLLQQIGPILIQQLTPILTSLLTKWLGGLTVPPVVPPVVPPTTSPAIPNLP